MKMHPEYSDLLDQYLVGTISEADFGVFQARLRESADLRRALRDHATIESKLSEIAAADPVMLSLWPVSDRNNRSRGSVGFGWLTWIRAPMGALAAGIAIGICSATLLWGYVAPHFYETPQMELPLADAGFESGKTPASQGVPTFFGVWSGDFVRVVDAVDAPAPFEGQKMLQFLRTDNSLTEPGLSTTASEIWQVVDLRPWREQLRKGVIAELRAAFSATTNAAPCKFGLGFHAFAGSVTNAPELWNRRAHNALAGTEKDEPASTFRRWQHLTTQMSLPPEADLLLVTIRVSATGASLPNGAVEFHGCFADDVVLTLRPIANNTMARYR